MAKKSRKGGSSWPDRLGIIALIVIGAAALASGSLIASGLVTQIPINGLLWFILYIAIMVWMVKVAERLDAPGGWRRAIGLGSFLTLSPLLVLWINGSWDAPVLTPLTANQPSTMMALDVATLTAIVTPTGIAVFLVALWNYRVHSKT